MRLFPSCCLIVLALMHSLPANGQSGFVSGTFIDSTSREPLPFVNIVINETNDTLRWAGASTDLDGRFRLGPMVHGSYRIQASHIGHLPFTRTIELSTEEIDLGLIALSPSATQLAEVEIQGVQVRVEQLGDTTQFNADAFKSAPDATAEDLLKKMPGITQEGGVLKAQGEEVTRVLVDGKPFFGDDPNLALKNLPAEIIDKIQVFDQLSDQAEFTGFDDGTGSKTINIVTKIDMRHGIFGRLYAGHDASDLYSTGGSVNIMNGDRRLSIIGMSNNINQQNFGDQDLLGVTAESGGGGRGGRGGGGRGGGRGGQGGGSASNFLIGPQGGVSTTHSIGLNYSDQWGRNTEVTGSYFLNVSERDLRTELVREQFLPGNSSLFYSEDHLALNRNLNHRLNMRVEHKIDTMNSLVITPRLSFQGNGTNSSTYGVNAYPSGLLESATENRERGDREGYSFNTGLLWRHRFAKPRRALSIQGNVELNDREGERHLYSLNAFDLVNDTTTLDRRTDDLVSGQRYGARITYTEPLGEKRQLQLNYAPAYTNGLTDRIANALDPDLGVYTLLDTSLSNRFASTYISQRGGASIRSGGRENWSWNIGLDAQHATLSGERTFPLPFSVERDFTNLLPNGMIGFSPAKGTNLRFFYRTSTREPSIEQLQDVVDISNPLFLRTGNPLLSQSYMHSLTGRYGRTNAAKGTSFFAMMSASLTEGYIGTSTTVATSGPINMYGLMIPVGGQFSRPVNLDGAWNGRSLVTYGFPIAAIKSNLNINGGYNFNQLPALINDRTNIAANHTLSQGAMLGSNISEQLDFALGYTANWSFVRNSLQQNADNDFLSTNATFRLQWTTPQHVVVRSNMVYTRFDGLAEEIDAAYMLWNASVGYKLLKDRSLELSLNVFDILNENNSIARNITETWVEDSRTNVLGRYAMLTITWNMRYFRKAPPAEDEAPR